METIVTTIAVRDGVLAVDSSVTDGNRYEGCAKKWRRGKDWVAAVAGALSAVNLLDGIVVDDAGIPSLNYVAMDETSEGFILTQAGVFYFSRCGVTTWEAKFYAAGSGGTLAIGAMAAGASAHDAVQIACVYDVKTAEPVMLLQVLPQLAPAMNIG